MAAGGPLGWGFRDMQGEGGVISLEAVSDRDERLYGVREAKARGRDLRGLGSRLEQRGGWSGLKS